MLSTYSATEPRPARALRLRHRFPFHMAWLWRTQKSRSTLKPKLLICCSSLEKRSFPASPRERGRIVFISVGPEYWPHCRVQGAIIKYHADVQRESSEAREGPVVKLACYSYRDGGVLFPAHMLGDPYRPLTPDPGDAISLLDFDGVCTHVTYNSQTDTYIKNTYFFLREVLLFI